MKRIAVFVALSVLLSSTLFISCKGPEVPVDPKPDDKPIVEKPSTWPEAGMENASYITNGKIQIGVDLERGGSIFHFSTASEKHNLLNHNDEGRFVQQSYYGDEDGSKWNGNSWRWNPVQGGSWQGKKASITSKSISDSKITVSTCPMHWATGELLTECSMTEVITLEGDCAHIQYSFTNSGKSHKARHQEMPAVFCDYDLGSLVYYKGSKPWTGDVVTRTVPKNLSDGATNQYVTRTEEWSAYVDNSDYGLGVYTPGTTQITYYTFGHGPGGAGNPSCSYFAPIRTLAITKGLELKYDVYLTIGTLEQIRSRFKALHDRL